MQAADRRPGPGEQPLVEEQARVADQVRLLLQGLARESGAGDAPSSQEPAADTSVLGDFRVLRRLGSGGMSTVFEAEQLSLRRRVALKILAPHLAGSEEALRRFRREAEAGGRPTHPGIVAVHAADEHDGVPYIVAELVGEGRTLADQIAEHRRAGELPRGWFRLVARQLAQVADALAHAHACEVIHRDVKPSNILLDHDGRPRIGDFGLARIEGAAALSGTGDFSGTPSYMSPEQVRGRRSQVDHRTDVYSLGVTLYECLTLRRPFGTGSPQEILSAVSLRDPPDPRRLDPRVPRELAAVCLKAMEKDPRRRYATMDELAGDLRRFLAGEAVRAEPYGRLQRTRRWLVRRRLQVAGVSVALLAAGVTAVLVALLAAQREESRRVAEARFVPLKEALWLGRPRSVLLLERWHARVVPQAPEGPMLAALVALARNDLERASAGLADCIERCSSSGDRALEVDARYLRAVVSLELSRSAPPTQVAALRDLAARDLEDLEPFDALEREALVWRGGAEGSGLRGLRLDRRHRLVHLYLGIAGFEELYKGGPPEAFRETVAHLEAALARRPDDPLATGLLGRTLLFQARSYDRHDLLPRAGQLSQRAEQLTQGLPYYLWSTTLAQVRLERGDARGALEALQAAERAGPDPTCDGHNVPLGFGRAHAALGRRAEALARMEQALALCSQDAHSLLGVVELCFESDPERAERCALLAWRRPRAGVRDARAGSGVAAAALALARLHAAAGEVDEAQAWLRQLADTAIPSGREFGLACRLALTLSHAERSHDPELDLDDTMRLLMQFLEWTTHPLDDRDSAITWSGIGAALLGLRQPEDAAAALERALRARERWPAGAREAHWPDEACDLYVLALAHQRLADLAARQPTSHSAQARERFDQAELLVLAHAPPWEHADLLQRLRAQARHALGGP